MPIKVAVSLELADAFEAHAHLLEPATIVGKDTSSNPLWCTYYLHHPTAPPGAASVCPVWQCSWQDGESTVSLLYLEWYDEAGHPLPAPAAAPAHGTAH